MWGLAGPSTREITPKISWQWYKFIESPRKIDLAKPRATSTNPRAIVYHGLFIYSRLTSVSHNGYVDKIKTCIMVLVFQNKVIDMPGIPLGAHSDKISTYHRPAMASIDAEL
jgi:hypothetical protein